MARQRVGEKKVRQIRERLGLPIRHILVRGGTDHRMDLCLEDGSVVEYWPRTGEMEKSSMRWNRPEGGKTQT